MNYLKIAGSAIAAAGIIGMLAAGSATAATTEKRPDKKNAAAQAVSAQATFVELGSVNCIPCKAMQPVMKEIEQEYAGKVTVVFYDVWTEAGKPYAEQYKIRAIPTQVFLDKDGREFFRHMGFFPAAEIRKVLEKQGITKTGLTEKKPAQAQKSSEAPAQGQVCK